MKDFLSRKSILCLGLEIREWGLDRRQSNFEIKSRKPVSFKGTPSRESLRTCLSSKEIARWLFCGRKLQPVENFPLKLDEKQWLLLWFFPTVVGMDILQLFSYIVGSALDSRG
jgi:hypothetical protein